MNFKKLTKKRILKNSTCKFQLIPDIIPLEDILNGKPVFLIEEIASLLDIKPSDINAKAFREWRRRLIKKHEKEEDNKREREPSKIFNQQTKLSDEQTDIGLINAEFAPIPEG